MSRVFKNLAELSADVFARETRAYRDDEQLALSHEDQAVMGRLLACGQWLRAAACTDPGPDPLPPPD